LTQNFFILSAAAILACNSSTQESKSVTAKPIRESIGKSATYGLADAWAERVRANTCRRTTYPTASWPQFLTGKGQLTIRVPPLLPQDRFEAARESTKTARNPSAPITASGWNDLPAGHAQLTLGIQDSAALVLSGPLEQEEHLCLERIDGAEATVLSYKWTIHPGDDVYLGPYIAFANMRFPDGLSVQVFGSANTPDQRDQMLAAIRTVRRLPHN
jgi:hypothetical protein